MTTTHVEVAESNQPRNLLFSSSLRETQPHKPIIHSTNKQTTATISLVSIFLVSIYQSNIDHGKQYDDGTTHEGHAGTAISVFLLKNFCVAIRLLAFSTSKSQRLMNKRTNKRTNERTTTTCDVCRSVSNHPSIHLSIYLSSIQHVNLSFFSFIVDVCITHSLFFLASCFLSYYSTTNYDIDSTLDS